MDKALEFLPGVGTVNTIAMWISYLVIFVILLLIAAGLSFMWAYNKKYNITINIFEKIGDNYQATRKDVARVIRLGHAGDTVHYWRRGKVFRPTPIIQSGPRTYWYFVREDGEYINFGVGDLDRIAKELGCEMIITDMRYAKEGLKKNLKDRYDKPGFFQQYGAHIALLSLMFMFGIAVWFSFYQMTDVLAAISQLTDKTATLMETANGMLVRVDNIQSGGSGIVPALTAILLSSKKW